MIPKRKYVSSFSLFEVEFCFEVSICWGIDLGATFVGNRPSFQIVFFSLSLSSRFTECHTKELVEVLFGGLQLWVYWRILPSVELTLEVMASAVMNMTTAALDWVSVAFDAPLARAVVFGVHIDGGLSSSCAMRIEISPFLIQLSVCLVAKIWLFFGFAWWLKGTWLLKCYLLRLYCSSSPEKAISLPRSHLQRRFVYYLSFCFSRSMAVWFTSFL